MRGKAFDKGYETSHEPSLFGAGDKTRGVKTRGVARQVIQTCSNSLSSCLTARRVFYKHGATSRAFNWTGKWTHHTTLLQVMPMLGWLVMTREQSKAMDEEALASQTTQGDRYQDAMRTWTPEEEEHRKTDQKQQQRLVRMRRSKAFGWPYLLVKLRPWGRVLNQSVSHDD